MRYVIALTALLTIHLTANAENAELHISAAEITGYGLFETRTSARHSGFSRSRIASDSVTGVSFTDFTNEIPGELGRNFGFQYSINTTPRGKKLKIRSVIRFPEPGLQQPGGKLYKDSVEHKEIVIGARDLHGYGFDEPWEIVPGEWVFEIWHRKARLIKKTFIVKAPASADAEMIEDNDHE